MNRKQAIEKLQSIVDWLIEISESAYEVSQEPEKVKTNAGGALVLLENLLDSLEEQNDLSTQEDKDEEH